MSVFLILSLTFLSTALIFEFNALYYAFYVCLAVLVISRWHTPRILSQLQVQRRFNSNAFLGETVNVDITVTNTSRFAIPWLRVQEGLPWELRVGKGLNEVASMGGGQVLSTNYEMRARRRGLYQIGPLFVATGDLFGLSPDRVVSDSFDRITVYPRISNIDRWDLPSRLPFGTLTSTHQLFSDPLKPAGVRDYQAGDSLRQINWKATGHTGELMVNNYQPAKSLESMILVNLHPDDFQLQNWHDGVEWGIELAASIAAHLARQRQAVGLATNGLDPLDNAENTFDTKTGRLKSMPGVRSEHLPPALLPHTGRAQLIRVLELLARVEGARNQTFAHWAPNSCQHLGWGVTVFAITPTADAVTCQIMGRFARSGYNPVLIVTEPIHFAPVQTQARTLGFSAIQLTHRNDFERWQQPMRHYG